MTALAADRNTPRLQGEMKPYPVKAATKIFAGALVFINASGYALPGAEAAGMTAVGRAEEQVDNSAGANGALTVRVRCGAFRWANSSSGDAITIADIGKPCWAVDDQTVAKTSGAGTRSRAGVVVDVDDNGVWVETEPSDAAGITEKHYVPIRVTTLAGSNSYYAVAPVAGRITAIRSIIEGALTTGNATLTGKINGTAITSGVITIAQSGSAAGDVDSAAPTAANAVDVGDAIALTVGGTNDAAIVANCLVEITV